MSSKPLALVLLSLPLLLPQGARAGLVINEVAWMGTDESASCEWVEFRNDGNAVSLSGWTFTIANSGSTPKTITLSGDVSAGDYFVLARNASACLDDAGATAGYTFTSFGSGISNSATVLTLSDGAGYEDEVDASGGWDEVGGENESGKPRKTAQRAGSGWVTALPTPMQENAQVSDTDTATSTTEVPSDTGTSTPTVTIGGAAPSNGPLDKSPARVLHLDAGVNRVVLAGAPTPFSAVAYTEKGKVRSDVKIRWNFGDGRTGEGREVSHAYRTPGTYLVTIRAREGDATTLRTLTVQAEKPSLSLSLVPDGISLTNESTRTADLSGWQIHAGGTFFTIPNDTAILPRASVVLSAQTTGLTATSSALLMYPDGTLLYEHAYVPATEEVSKPRPKKPVAKPAASTRGIQKVQKVDLPTTVSEQVHEEVIEAPAATTMQAAAGAAQPPSAKASPNWLLCLFASPLACGAALSVP